MGATRSAHSSPCRHFLSVGYLGVSPSFQGVHPKIDGSMHFLSKKCRVPSDWLGGGPSDDRDDRKAARKPGVRPRNLRGVRPADVWPTAHASEWPCPSETPRISNVVSSLPPTRPPTYSAPRARPSMRWPS